MKRVVIQMPRATTSGESTTLADGSAAHLTSWCKEDQYPKVDRLNDIAGMMLKAQVAGLPTAAGASCPP